MQAGYSGPGYTSGYTAGPPGYGPAQPGFSPMFAPPMAPAMAYNTGAHQVSTVGSLDAGIPGTTSLLAGQKAANIYAFASSVNPIGAAVSHSNHAAYSALEAKNAAKDVHALASSMGTHSKATEEKLNGLLNHSKGQATGFQAEVSALLTKLRSLIQETASQLTAMYSEAANYAEATRAKAMQTLEVARQAEFSNNMTKLASGNKHGVGSHTKSHHSRVATSSFGGWGSADDHASDFPGRPFVVSLPSDSKNDLLATAATSFPKTKAKTDAATDAKHGKESHGKATSRTTARGTSNDAAGTEADTMEDLFSRALRLSDKLQAAGDKEKWAKLWTDSKEDSVNKLEGAVNGAYAYAMLTRLAGLNAVQKMNQLVNQRLVELQPIIGDIQAKADAATHAIGQDVLDSRKVAIDGLVKVHQAERAASEAVAHAGNMARQASLDANYSSQALAAHAMKHRGYVTNSVTVRSPDFGTLYQQSVGITGISLPVVTTMACPEFI